MGKVCEENNILLNDKIRQKINFLDITLSIRHGIMLVGKAGTCKTTLYETLDKIYQKMGF